MGRGGGLVISESAVVAEVLVGGDVITYDISVFDENDAADFLDLGLEPHRNFFFATRTLIPYQEDNPS